MKQDKKTKAKSILAYYVDEVKKIIDSTLNPSYSNTYKPLDLLEKEIKSNYTEYKNTGEEDGTNYATDLKLALKKAQNYVYLHSNLKNKVKQILEQEDNLSEEEKRNLHRVLQEIQIGWALSPEIYKTSNVEAELNDLKNSF